MAHEGLKFASKIWESTHVVPSNHSNLNCSSEYSLILKLCLLNYEDPVGYISEIISSLLRDTWCQWNFQRIYAQKVGKILNAWTFQWVRAFIELAFWDIMSHYCFFMSTKTWHPPFDWLSFILSITRHTFGNNVIFILSTFTLSLTSEYLSHVYLY